MRAAGTMATRTVKLVTLCKYTLQDNNTLLRNPLIDREADFRNWYLVKPRGGGRKSQVCEEVSIIYCEDFIHMGRNVQSLRGNVV